MPRRKKNKSKGLLCRREEVRKSFSEILCGQREKFYKEESQAKGWVRSDPA